MSEVTQKVDVEAGVIDKRNRLMEIIEAIGSSSKLASNVLYTFIFLFVPKKILCRSAIFSSCPRRLFTRDRSHLPSLLSTSRASSWTISFCLFARRRRTMPLPTDPSRSPSPSASSRSLTLASRNWRLSMPVRLISAKKNICLTLYVDRCQVCHQDYGP